MDERKHKKGNGVKLWLVIGVIVLIILLLLWLTVADMLGDTDVAAQVMQISQSIARQA